ncbi:MAG: glycosyltransferase family 39 protein [Pseudomonadota bacterium]
MATPKAAPKTAPGPEAAKPASGKPSRPRRLSKAAEAALWRRRTALMLLAVCALRLLLNAATVIPVHFDEAQYWAYGQERAFGHYSKPPLVGWAILASTQALGDTLFGLRAFAPVMHLIIAVFVFAIGERGGGPRLGFWAAAIYTAAPGVSISSHLMTTDPVMMAGWALGLYALMRAMEVKPGRKTAEPYGWWALAGAAIGLGMLAKYTAVAMPLGALGYALFSREDLPGAPTRRRGALTAGLAGLIVLSPNLIWQAANGFVTILHLGENSEAAAARIDPADVAEFWGAQLGVFGPVALAALFAALWTSGRRGDWRDRLLIWVSVPLLAAMTAQALLAGANANWAAPAYVGGSVLAAKWLLTRDLRWAKAQLWSGAALFAAVWALGAVYAVWAADLPRTPDPFKKMRIGGPFCELALNAMESEGASVLLSNDRRRLSECQFQGGLTFEDVAVHSPDPIANNHVEFRSRLTEGDDRPMVLIVESAAQAAEIAALFETAEPLGEGYFATHADREVGYALWYVEGFGGY